MKISALVIMVPILCPKQFASPNLGHSVLASRRHEMLFGIDRLLVLAYCELEKHLINVCRDSSVGVATGYGLDDRMIGVRFPAGLGIFIFDTASRTALGPTQPPIRGEGLFPWG
jgi:hypothetical protein